LDQKKQQRNLLENAFVVEYQNTVVQADSLVKPFEKQVSLVPILGQVFWYFRIPLGGVLYGFVNFFF